MRRHDVVSRALNDGAHRSRAACSLPANDAWPIRIWRRHRWKIIGAGLFILIELIGLGTLGRGFPHT